MINFISVQNNDVIIVNGKADEIQAKATIFKDGGKAV